MLGSMGYLRAGWPRALVLFIATSMVLGGVTAQTQAGVVTPGRVPDFAGMAVAISPVTLCPQTIPRELHNPPNHADDPQEYVLHGCWRGDLAGKRFFLGLYQTQAHDEAGLSVQHGGTFVGWLDTEAIPHIVRFTRDYVCVGVRGDSFWQAIDIATGKIASDEDAVEMCHFRTGDGLPGGDVLGLKDYYREWGAPCATSQLSTEYDQRQSDGIDGGVGHHAITIAIRNRSATTCVLHGVPAATLSPYPSGHTLAMMICSNCDDYLFSHQVASVVRLSPGDSAYLVMGYDINDSVGRCTQTNSPVTLALYIHGQARPLGIRFDQWRSCGFVDMTPFLNHPPANGSLPREP